MLLSRVDEHDAVDSSTSISSTFDPLVAGGGQVLADVVGPDRQLAVAAVDEHCELHPLRPAVVEQGLDRRPDRAARVEDVVHDHDRLALEREVEPGGLHDRLGMGPLLAARTATSSR